MLSRNHYSQHVEKTAKVVSELTAILQQEEFSEYLQQYLSKNYPQYINILEQLFNDIFSNEQCVFICGERCRAKHELLSGLCGEIISEATYQKINNASLVIKTDGFAGIKVFQRGREVNSLACRVENIQKEQQKIKERLDDISDNVCIFRDCNVEVSKSEKSKVNATFVDVADDFGEKSVAIGDYLRQTASIIFVVDIGKATDIQRANTVLNEVLKKVNDFRPYSTNDVIFLPNRKWERSHQKLASTTTPVYSKNDIAALALQEIIPFIKTENVFDLTRLENINQFEEFVGRIKRDVLLGEEDQIKTSLQFLRRLVCRAVKGICIKEGIVQANNPKYEVTIERVSKTLMDVQRGYSQLSRRSTADIQDVLTELTKVVSTAEVKDEEDIEEEPKKGIDEKASDSLNLAEDFEILEDLAKLYPPAFPEDNSDNVVDSDFDELKPTYLPERLDKSVEKVTDAVTQSVFDLRQAVQRSESESRGELENHSKRFQLLSDLVNQLLTIEDIQREFEDVPQKEDAPSSKKNLASSKCALSYMEGQLRLGKVYEKLEKIISSKEYDGALKHELELVCPNYRKALASRAEDLKRTDSSIVIAGAWYTRDLDR